MKPLALASLAASLSVHAGLGTGALALLSSMSTPAAPRMEVSVESLTVTALPADAQKRAEVASLAAAAPSPALASAPPVRLEASAVAVPRADAALMGEAATPGAAPDAAQAERADAAQAALAAALEPATSPLAPGTETPLGQAQPATPPTAQGGGAASPAPAAASPLAAAASDVPDVAPAAAPMAASTAAAEAPSLGPADTPLAAASRPDPAAADAASDVADAIPVTGVAASDAPPPRRAEAPDAARAQQAPTSVARAGSDAKLAASAIERKPAALPASVGSSVASAAPGLAPALPDAALQAAVSAAPVRATTAATALPAARPAAGPRVPAAGGAPPGAGQERPQQMAALVPPDRPVPPPDTGADARSRVLGFLGGYRGGGDCFLALDMSRSGGPPAVAQFAADTRRLTAFADAAAGNLPGVVSYSHAVGKIQCSVLRFARSLPRYPDFALAIETDQRTVRSGAYLRGIVTGPFARSAFLFLVDDEGEVLPVDRRYIAPVARGSAFKLPLTLKGRPKSPAQIMIALSGALEGLPVLADPKPQPAAAFFKALERQVAARGLDLDLDVDFAIQTFLVE